MEVVWENKYRDVLINTSGKVTIQENGHCLSNNVLCLDIPGIERRVVGDITDECIVKITAEGYDTNRLVKAVLLLKKHCYREQSIEFCLYDGELTVKELETVGRLFSIGSPEIDPNEMIKDLYSIDLMWDKDLAAERMIEESLLYDMTQGTVTPEYLDAIGYPHESMEAKLKEMRVF